MTGFPKSVAPVNMNRGQLAPREKFSPFWMFGVPSIDMQPMLRNEGGRIRIISKTLDPLRRGVALERIGKFNERTLQGGQSQSNLPALSRAWTNGA